VKIFNMKPGSRVTCLTFGGQQSWTIGERPVIFWDRVVERNDSYTIISSGLNHYVLESSAILSEGDVSL
jgi:hypothetical protein